MDLKKKRGNSNCLQPASCQSAASGLDMCSLLLVPPISGQVTATCDQGLTKGGVEGRSCSFLDSGSRSQGLVTAFCGISEEMQRFGCSVLPLFRKQKSVAFRTAA